MDNYAIVRDPQGLEEEFDQISVTCWVNKNGEQKKGFFFSYALASNCNYILIGFYGRGNVAMQFMGKSYPSGTEKKFSKDYNDIIEVWTDNTQLHAQYRFILISGITLEAESWYHLAVTWSRGGSLKVYVNGELKWSTVLPSDKEITRSGGVLVIGQVHSP